MNWKPIGMRPSDYVAEMNAAMDHRLYVSALNAALIIPDVCATALDPNSRTNSEKYEAWVTEYLIPIFKGHGVDGLSAGDVYQLRNSVLHNGSFATDAGKATRYHNIRVHVFESPSQLITGSGSIGLGDKCPEEERERRLTINLTAYAHFITSAVETFLSVHPECDREIDKGRLAYGGLVDFTVADSTSRS